MKTIIITGASDGLGKALAELCVKNDMRVVNVSRSICGIEGVVDIPCDLSREHDLYRTAEIIKANYADFTALVNNAAIVGFENINEITYKKFERAWKVNAIAPLFLTSQLFDLIVKNEADVINVGTTHNAANAAGAERPLVYVASKYGLRGGSYNIAGELKATRSRLIQVHLGAMNTDLHIKDYNAKIDDREARMKPSDIAEILLYLINLPKQIEISEITINRKNRRMT